MDDMKTLHDDKGDVSYTIIWLESIYSEIHSTRRKRYEYLDMWMDYSKRGEVKIFIEVYLRKILDDFLEEIIRRVEMPSATDLFEVRSGKE